MELRESDFEEMVLLSDRPVLVHFRASWSPPCKLMQSVVDRLAIELDDWADVYSVDVDRSQSLAQQYEVTEVPTFVTFADGQFVNRKTGSLTAEQMIAMLDEAELILPDPSSAEFDGNEDHETDDDHFTDLAA